MKVVEMTPKEFTNMINKKSETEEFQVLVDISSLVEQKYSLKADSIEGSIPLAYEKDGEVDG